MSTAKSAIGGTQDSPASPDPGAFRAGGAHPSGSCRITLPTPCRHPAPCGLPCELKLGPERHAVVELGQIARFALMAVPGSRGPFLEQASELLAQIRCILDRQPGRLVPTTLMVFLRDGGDEAACRELVSAVFGESAPVTTVVVQPPCCGAALGIELWAVGGAGVTVTRHGPGVLSVACDGIRWIHCGGVPPETADGGAYPQSMRAFESMRDGLASAGARFDQLVRTWIYINRITDEPGGVQRYKEFNRARTDFYHGIPFGCATPAPATSTGQPLYPASTGIGTQGERVAMAGLALDSTRSDVFLVPLENPQQTPAFNYQATYSPQSPKFVRAMAVVQGHFVSLLVSGTASIVDSRSVHPGDIGRQTAQTLDNIESLIAAGNLARHGLPGCGARLGDVAKLRVYVKNPSDYEQCREVVEQRLPGVPAIYLHADVCRPELLVEIEAVAFVPFTGVPKTVGSPP